MDLRAPFGPGQGALNVKPTVLSGGASGTVASRLEARTLRIWGRVGGRPRTIVSDVELSVGPGETVGIVGESGSGKSMTGRSLIGLLPDGVFAEGEILYGGRNLLDLPERELRALRGSEIGLILQDPFTMLNPLMRCGNHITEVLSKHNDRRLGRQERRDEALRRLSEVGLPDVAASYPFQLSGGMRQRVAIAAALAGDPKILVADEPTTALDVTTQKEILSLLKSLQESRSMGLILITHDLRVAFSVCDRIYVLYAGTLLEMGQASLVEEEPLHPYTLGLLLSEPPVGRRLSKLVAIPGAVPAPDEVAACCTFSPRCTWAMDICRTGRPALELVTPHRRSACLRINEIREEMSALRRTAQQATPAEVVASAKPLVQIQDLCKVFETSGRRSRQSVDALIDVSLDIRENESVGLVGESGSGKTTLARCLLGLEKPTTGRILIDGVDVTDYGALSHDERRRVRRSIQIVFQDPYSSLNPVRTVAATLKEAIAIGESHPGQLDPRMLELLEQVGLSSAYASRKPVALSGGERQRVAIARALAVRPKIIVYDEAVSSLDVSVQAQILNLLTSLRGELRMSCLFITHDLAVVRQVVERVYVLHNGSVVEHGPVKDVLDHPAHPYTARLVDSVPRSEADWLLTAGPDIQTP